MQEMKLYLVRHGDMAGDPFVCPTPPVSGCLSNDGIEQAKRLALFLQSREIDAIISSPYGRAIQTAQIALDGRNLPIQIVNGLEEWKPNLDVDVDTSHEKLITRDDMLYAEETWKTSLGEGTFDMYARIVPAFLKAMKDQGWVSRMGGWVPIDDTCKKNIALFAHGGSLNVLLCFILGVSPFPIGKFGFEKTAVAQIIFSERMGIFYPRVEFIQH